MEQVFGLFIEKVFYNAKLKKLHTTHYLREWLLMSGPSCVSTRTISGPNSCRSSRYSDSLAPGHVFADWLKKASEPRSRKESEKTIPDICSAVRVQNQNRRFKSAPLPNPS
jgi:hypothetical protein